MNNEPLQRTTEWYAARCGKVTASRVFDIIARNKPKKGQDVGDYTAKRVKYMQQIIAERLAGVPQDMRRVKSLEDRQEMEPRAVAAYEFDQDCDVELVGFIPHPTIAGAGASPDGHVGANGSVEIKCPDHATHVNILTNGDDEWAEYLPQIQFQLACSGRQWCDFVSYAPLMPEDLKLFVKRVPRDDICIAMIEREIIKFIAEVDAAISQLTGGQQ